MQMRLGPQARCFLTTQASTKVYRNPDGRPCGHSLRADLATDSLLVLTPDPIQSFAGSIYHQLQEFHLAPGANLVLLDWFCSGRRARQERWNFVRLQSRNEIFVGTERMLLDSLLLDQSDGVLGGAHRMGRFNCLAVMVMTGAKIAADAARCLTEIQDQPVRRREGLLVSGSPIQGGAILRIAGERVEEVANEIRRTLSFVTPMLGDDPWARKW
jgi:urease accessory protein UreH